MSNDVAPHPPAHRESAPDHTPDRLAERLSVVLLTYNCAHRIAPVLDQLLALGVPVIAVDNASTDGTPDVLEQRPGLQVVAMEKNIGAAARNVGLRRAGTPYVAFADDDGWYERPGLVAAADLLDRNQRLALVNTRIQVRPRSAEHESYVDPISSQMAASPLPDTAGIPGPVLISFMGGACIVRVTAFEEVGGYDPEFFLGGEEETLAFKFLKAGWHMRYLADAVMHHRPSVANAPRLRAFGLRNTLWNAWLHRRFRSAVRHTAFTLADNPKNRDWVRGVLMAVRGAGWVARRRSPMPAELDAMIAVLDRGRSRRPLLNRHDPIHEIARRAAAST